tara:strand:+ start:2178 stop:2438 length:261 start_codon:yes stop_codon:yes gene_type:complete
MGRGDLIQELKAEMQRQKIRRLVISLERFQRGLREIGECYIETDDDSSSDYSSEEEEEASEEYASEEEEEESEEDASENDSETDEN